MSFNTQPPKGGWVTTTPRDNSEKGFNTQPPKGGWSQITGAASSYASFNTQPPKGGWLGSYSSIARKLGFQHTAA